MRLRFGRGRGATRRGAVARRRVVRPWLVEQLRCELSGEARDLVFEVALLGCHCWMRRARLRSAFSVPRTSTSRCRAGRTAARRLSSRPRVSGRSSLRSGSGAVMIRSRSWQRPARRALTAPRVRPSTPVVLHAGRRCAAGPAATERARRAARIASSASVLPPERRSRRSRPTSNTVSPCAATPGEAGAERAAAFNRIRTSTRRVLPG